MPVRLTTDVKHASVDSRLCEAVHVDFAEELVVVRGGGDLATGVVLRLVRAGFPVVVTELAEPLTVRRTVAFSAAVDEGVVTIEGVTGRLVEFGGAAALYRSGEVAVVVCPTLPALGAEVVIDARLAKRNLDTTMDDAAFVVALGPGFTVGVDCHAVIETNRGHRLGRVLWRGSAEPNTGTPGLVAGRAAERVIRATVAGEVDWRVAIGDVVDTGDVMGSVGETVITAAFPGLVRGLIRPGPVAAGLKIGDVDARVERAMCHEVSDKALAIAGGVLEAILMWMRKPA